MSTHQSTNFSANVIIAAGGDGARMGKNKQLMNLRGKPVIARTMEAFQNHPLIDKIILVRPPSLADEFKHISSKYKITKLVAEADSGPTRLDSIYNGLMKTPVCPAVLIHNGANPLVTETEITACVKATLEYGAAVVANLIKDTIKEVDKDGFVKKTLSRSGLMAMQTPQGIRYELAKKAMMNAISKGLGCTDDVQAVEFFDPTVKIKTIPASPQNFKLTTPMDAMLAEALLSDSLMDNINNLGFRVGNGEDSHKFIPINDKQCKVDKKKQLVVGGVAFPGEVGFMANSDGDVVYHALTRAISAAVGGPSIGFFADELARDGFMDSRLYLIGAMNYVEESGFEIQNVSVIVEGKRPKINDHIPEMKKNIGRILRLSDQQIGISPHSGEGMTEFGRGLGMRAQADVLLKRIL